MKVFVLGLSLCLFLGTLSVWSLPYSGGQSLHSIVVLKSAPALLAGGSQNNNRSRQSRTPVPATTYKQQLLAQQSGLFEQCRQVDPQAELGAQFTDLINAFSVRMNAEALGELREHPDVKYISRVKTYKPTLTQSGQLMRLPEAYEKFEFGDNAGEGVFIAIIDSGVDATHPAFEGDGYEYPEGFPKGNADFTNKKIIAARVFPPGFGQQGDTTLFDRDGHGSNVASISAANLDVKSPLGFLSGVAPRAYLGNYKIFTTDGASSEQIIAAIEAAVSDGADVLNMSFGFSAFDEPHHSAELDAVRNAVAAGAVAVIAAQNEGRAFTIGAPAQVEEAITVGAITNSHRANGTIDQYALRVSLWVNGEPVITEEQANFGSPSDASASSGFYTEPIIGAFSVVDADTLDGGAFGGDLDGRACNDFPAGASASDWVLVQRGECQFVDKAARVQAIGGRGVLFYQNDRPDSELIIPDSENLSVPVVLVGRDFGLAIKEALSNGDKATIEVIGGPVSDQPFTSNRMATFSSLGPSAEYSFKPDVSAIGAGSFGATQNDQDFPGSQFTAGGFRWVDGTSQASPRVAGLAALVRQLHPNWPPDWVKSAIVISTANTAKNSNGSREANAMETGAGRVDAFAAGEVDTIVLPPKLGFGRLTLSDSGSVERYLRIVNASAQECEYVITPVRFNNALSVELSDDSFTLPPGEKIEIKATASASSPSGLTDLEQRLQLSNLTTGLNYSIACWMRTVPAPGPQSVLLVDDDNGESFEETYMGWLDAIERTYVHWDVDGKDDYPTANYMHGFDAVVWVQSGKSFNAVGDPSSDAFVIAWNPQHLFETELQRYLGEGGALLHSGQDYFDQKDDSTLAAEAYGVRMAVHDQGASTIAGVSGNPVGEGVASFSMNYSNGLEDFVDMVRPIGSRGTAETAFTSNGSSSRSVGVTIEGCNYRAVFLAFPLEAAPDESGQQILRNSLDWLDEASFAPAQVVSIVPDEIDLDTETGPFFLSIDGEGFTYGDGYRAWFDSVPMEDVFQLDCNRVEGVLPADLQPGVYTLTLSAGNGRTLRLENALTVKAEAKTPDWFLH
ncbi:MAG: S8 family serine peptidase [Candidatus Hinthialibacter antarcticus]|nr:S8 family serine peptidase [Candidatus Hinthialibacter antarcticus]